MIIGKKIFCPPQTDSKLNLLIGGCSHNDPLMSPGKSGVTPGRGGAETLTSAPDGTNVILYF